MGGRPRGAAGQGEGADPRPRRAGRRAPPDAADGRREGVPLRGPGRPGEPARPVRGAPPADRLPLLLRARRGRLARERLPRLLVRRRPGRPPRPSERPRHHARVRLARAAGRHRALEGADGLGASPGTRSPTTSTPTSASDEWHGTNAFFRDDDDRIFRTYFVDEPRRRGDGQHLELPRHHRARPPGGVGGLARGLPADPALRVVEPPRRVRRGDRPRAALPSRPLRERGSRARARDRSRGRRAAGGDPAVARRRRRRPAGGARLADACACDADGSPGDDRHQDAAHRAHLPGARRGGLRRVDERGGDPPLVARRARLGDDRGRGRPARRRRRARRHARPGQGRRVRRRRQLHRDRPADPPGVHLDLGRRHAGGR